MESQLSIVIVNWNGGDYLRSAIQHVLDDPPTVSWEMIVVDNHSTDGSLAYLTAAEENLGGKLRVVRNQDNVGFSKANNQAFALSRSQYVFLLNPDADVKPGSIELLISILRDKQDVAACAPKLLNPDGSLQHSVYHNPPTPWSILLGGTPLLRLLPARLRGEMLLGYHWDHSRQRNVPFFTGAAVMVRRRVLEELGPLDERFAMFAEDHEWCLRMTRAGWKLLFEPSAEVVHHVGRSAMQKWKESGSADRRLQAFLRFQEQCLPRIHYAANLAAMVVVHSIEALRARVKGLTREQAEFAKANRRLCSRLLRQALLFENPASPFVSGTTTHLK